ncbi:MAG TPA: PhzF family phenazine biosynthesis isomerase [Acidimicrobiales bacterium]|jgi:PhzF family phenazine biosynthesis protein|nr:PhzF family phenazine biosynthesis isomerase [Acidimicrobiales bacterium]
MGVVLRVVDAFTDTPFRGNPAAVCVLDEEPPLEWMRAVAAEMNLAETAFAVRRADGDYDLRWFTPTVEVPLCGHATLATAHVLAVPARFHTRSGVLEATPSADGWIALDFPATRPSTVRAPAGLEVALGVGEPTEGISRGEILEVAEFGHGASLLVELGSAEQVRDLAPDLREIERIGAHMLVVTAAGDIDGIDCVSRVFAPGAGIPEDPVTGSAHCALAPWWSARVGRVDLVGEQASLRGGLVGMHLDGERVILAGQAVTVSEIDFLVDPR